MGTCLRGWYWRSSAPFSAPDSSESGGVGSPLKVVYVSHFARGLLGPDDRNDDEVDGIEENVLVDELFSLANFPAPELPL